ncbi:MAG: hypothetical protein RLZZ282_1721 [Verrucomicrobiota bacterium]
MAETDLRIPRPMRRAVEEALADTPVVAVLGPRQVGKSTLVRELAPDRVAPFRSRYRGRPMVGGLIEAALPLPAP